MRDQVPREKRKSSSFKMIPLGRKVGSLNTDEEQNLVLTHFTKIWMRCQEQIRQVSQITRKREVGKEDIYRG